MNIPHSSDLYALHDVQPGSFIYVVDDAIPLDACSEMTSRFERHPEQHYEGLIGENQELHDEVKKSTDLRISGRPDWKEFDQLLFQSLQKAKRSIAMIHPFFSSNHFKDMGYNLQRTQTGEYYHWHVDHGPGGTTSQRALVAIWYLNDVPGPGGATEFMHQNLSIQPSAGRLVLFPPYWTHLHRNSTLEQGVKYIATTWMCLAD